MKYFIFALTVAATLQTMAAEPSFTSHKINDKFAVISGNGGNILLFGGNDAVLIDSGYGKNSAAFIDYLKTNNADIDYLINTHWHADHTGGNLALADTTIIAHDNLRNRLSAPQHVKFFNSKIDAQPEAAKPDITYQTAMKLVVDGQTFDIVHYAESHTDSDSVIFIQPANIVVLGDLYFSNVFPFIDPDSGGNIDNLINTLESVAQRIDDNTMVVPGHGKLASKADLQATIAMIKTSRDIVKACKDQGKSIDDCRAAGLPDDMVTKWGSNISEDGWIGIVYEAL